MNNLISKCCIQMLHPYIASNTKKDMALDVRFLIITLQFSPCVNYVYYVEFSELLFDDRLF